MDPYIMLVLMLMLLLLLLLRSWAQGCCYLLIISSPVLPRRVTANASTLLVFPFQLPYIFSLALLLFNFGRRAQATPRC